jgi:hypothetical protein
MPLFQSNACLQLTFKVFDLDNLVLAPLGIYFEIVQIVGEYLDGGCPLLPALDAGLAFILSVSTAPP